MYARKVIVWEPSICACECEKDFEIDKSLNAKTVNLLAVMCDKTLNTSIDSIDKKATYKVDYFFHTFSLVSKYLLLLIVIFINWYYMK